MVPSWCSKVLTRLNCCCCLDIQKPGDNGPDGDYSPAANCVNWSHVALALDRVTIFLYLSASFGTPVSLFVVGFCQ